MQVSKGNYIRIGGVMRGILVRNICDSKILVMDKSRNTMTWGTYMLSHVSKEQFFTDKAMTTFTQGIDNMARLCKERLVHDFSSSKATLKDLRVVAECCLTGDYSPAYRTSLYSKHSVEYTRALEVFEYICSGKLTASNVRR